MARDMDGRAQRPLMTCPTRERGHEDVASRMVD